MKKNLFKVLVFLIIVMVLISVNTITYGTYYKFRSYVFKESLLTVSCDTPATSLDKNYFLTFLRDYGYKGDEIYLDKQMKFDTTIKILNKEKSKYDIQIGNGKGKKTSTDNGFFDDTKAIKKGISEEKLKKKYGYNGQDSWKVVLIVSCKKSGFGEMAGYINYTYKITIDELYAGDDYEKGMAEEIEEGKKVVEDMTSALEVSRSIDKFTESFERNPIGTALTLFLDVIKTLADTIQMFINSAQALTLHVKPGIKYSYDYLENDGKQKEENKNGKGNIDAYTSVGDYSQGAKDGQIEEVINGTKEGIENDAEIPVVMVDMHNIAIGNISLFDVNFFSGNKSHDSDSEWMKLRNIFAPIVHFSIYISSAILITMLIWYGISIVRHSIDSPQSQVKAKEGITRLSIGVFRFIGTIVIMALCIFGSEMIMKYINPKPSQEMGKYEQPIRVKVKFSNSETTETDQTTETTETDQTSETLGVSEYSFSTNVTGYFGYLSTISDVDKYVNKAMYTFEYLGLVIINFFITACMVVRLFGMWILAIVGPIITILYALNLNNLGSTTYKKWLNLYILLSMMPIIFAIADRIIYECS